MKKLLLFLLSFSISCGGFAQSVADPAYANMQRAVGGILANATASAGYSATSPQTYGTLYGVGKVALAGVATAGAGLLVTGTAPAWGTVLAVAAISGAVSYGVGLGLDSAVKWAFGTPAATPVNVTVTTNANGNAGNYAALTVGGPYWSAANVPAGGDPYAVGFQSVQPANTSGGWTVWSFALNSGLSTSTRKAYNYSMQHPTSCAAGGCQAATVYVDYHSSGAPATCGVSQYYSAGCKTFNFSLTNPVLQTVQTLAQTMQQAVAALTDAQKAQQVNSETLATMVNLLWQKAAADPSYSGAPYVATRPITSTEVQAWMDKNPTIKPTVESLVAPVTNTSTGFAPSAPTAVNQPVAPVLSPTPPVVTSPSPVSVSGPVTVTGSVAVTGPVQVDFGTNPATPSPTLDAPDWLQPLLNMLPGWRSASFVAQGQCYTPSFDLRPVIPTVVTLSSHCNLLEAQRSSLSSVMAVVWAMVAAFIVLAA